jgi:hypothetical protein
VKALPQSLMCVGENRLDLGEDTRDWVLGNFQPSLADWMVLLLPTQD